MRDALAAFADLTPPGAAETSAMDAADTHHDGQPVTYPGSKKKRRAVAAPVDEWADFPFTELLLRGVMVRFYPVSVLAAKLERLPPAIRKWERLGYIPPSDYRSPGRTKNGQRRLYTRAQIEGLARLAAEEGLLGDRIRNVSATAFPARAAALFKELNAA